MSEHKKILTDLHLAHPFGEKIDFGMESIEIKFRKNPQKFFGAGCKNHRNHKINAIVKNKENTALADWAGLKMLQKSLLDSLQVVQKLQQLPEPASGHGEPAKNQGIQQTGHNSSARRVFADPSAEHFSNSRNPIRLSY